MLLTMRETYVDHDPKVIIHFFVIRIAPVAIIDRQLPFENTITSRSTDVVVPIPFAPAANYEANVLAEYNALYDVHNEVACLILGSMTPELHRQFKNYSPYEMLQELSSMFEKQAGVERFDLIQTFHACKQEEGKTIGELHAMLIEYEKGLPKKAETPQVMMIKGGKIQKAKKKSLKAKGKGKANGNGNDKQVYIPKLKNPKPYGKEHPAKDDACHHVSGRAVDLEEIQDEDTSPSKITSEIPMEVEGFEPPQEEVIPIRRSERTHRAPNRLCLNVEINAMNVEIQSMIDNMVWVLVNLPPGCKTVGSKWIFKKKTDMDGIIHTYKARLVAKGYTQLYEVNYEETFSPVADIRAIRILISIAVLLILIIPEKYTSFKDPFMVLSKHQEAGIKDLMRKSKGLVLIKISMSHVYIKRLVGVMLHSSVQQLTPPYTPQHNGVSEKRNRTLLDMVRSMMNLTTFPLSFWDYALESATRILNMVPTKKVDKTSYKLWYGKVPNLSYLKV
nr:zinc finger, CCHC-type [Tanacetum cinerariifolium]